jgi:hypothetical protein
MKRIIDGDADNVWIKYRAFVLENLKDRSDNPDNPAKN